MGLCFGLAPSRLMLRNLRHPVTKRSTHITKIRSCAAKSTTVPLATQTKSIERLTFNDNERVRFAPSPTGALHVGGARTALYNWLLARQNGGKFLIRVEDTDLERSKPEFERMVLDDLKWLGLHWDEGPTVGGPCEKYRQSERTTIYSELAHKLVDSGLAYPCFCDKETLDRKKALAEKEGRPPQYDGTCRDLDPDEVRERIAAGEEYTIRFRLPVDCRVLINDIVRGRVDWDVNKTLGDFILLRSNGLPVYNFCVAVDDAFMGVTTVIRANEHLNNTPRQVLVSRALGFDVPQFAHCSLINGSDGKKLSKRHGATSVSQFREEGYIPEAMLNYLATLGWNDGTEKEIFTVDELIETFDVKRLTKSAAQFDIDKLRHVNGVHVRNMPSDELVPLVTDVWRKHGVFDSDKLTNESELAKIGTEVVQGTLTLINDATEEMRLVLSYPLHNTIESGEADELLAEDGGFDVLGRAVVNAYDDGTLPIGVAGDEHMGIWKKWVKATGKQLGRKGKKLFHPLRLALTGKMSGPDVGMVLRVLHLASSLNATQEMVLLEKRIEVLRAELDKRAAE